MAKKTVPVAFLSRKLTKGQQNWVPRGQETYAIVLALKKWESWIGMQPVLILTDHKALESWAREVLDTPAGQWAEGPGGMNFSQRSTLRWDMYPERIIR